MLRFRTVRESLIRDLVSRNEIFKNVSGAEDITLNYYIDKKLSDVDKVRHPAHEHRFQGARQAFGEAGRELEADQISQYDFPGESFLMFWSTANLLFDIKKNYQTCNGFIEVDSNYQKRVKSTWTNTLNVKDNVFEIISKHDHFLKFLKWLLESKEFTCICLSDETLMLKSKIRELSPQSRIIKIDDIDDNLKGDTTHKNILVFYAAINLGLTLRDNIKKIKKAVSGDVSVTCLTIFARRNAVRETRWLSRMSFDELHSWKIPIYCFYTSALPYYLFEDNSGFHKFIDNQLKTQANVI